MSKPELEKQLRQAIDRINVGDLLEGRKLLEGILETDPTNDTAWVWLSGCVDDPRQRRICLQQALRANPNNQAALDGMKVLDGALVQATSSGPSLLESRLAAIGMGEGEAPPTQAIQPAAPTTPEPDFAPDEEVSEDAPATPRRRLRIVLLGIIVLLLAVIACGIVAYTVLLPGLNMPL